MLTIVVIGGGAAGFFAAIHAALASPKAKVILLEKTSKLLSKVRVSGGGRCNVTHKCFNVSEMSKKYPRGEKQMRQILHRFMTNDTIDWFEKRGVKLKAESDGRMFPITDSSQTIIDCLMQESQKLGIEIRLNCDVLQIVPISSPTLPQIAFELLLKEQKTITCSKVIVATGGSPKESGLAWLKELGHEVETPVPSLFTFNIPNNPIVKLMGLSVPTAKVKVQGTKLEAEGAVLATHWGLSGPAVLRLSAWGARELALMGYHFKISVNWLGMNEEKLRLLINANRSDFANKLITNCNLSVVLPSSDLVKISPIPTRLWEFLLEKTEIPMTKKWVELSKNELNRLINSLVNDEYEVKGKTTFKEEFVTCGGVRLSEIDLQSMQSKKIPNLYFTGEVLDIDGITGGFNFQAAWTTGYIAGTSAGQ
ncbi:MAG: NAD(P)/FAD-dependent oxidoreductase [Cytophagales bacterium]|nr:MAG: NAD(P)/FAD-dependent oxidoreductase [Cytophagales bacterium]